jgi:hypothetical protein
MKKLLLALFLLLGTAAFGQVTYGIPWDGPSAGKSLPAGSIMTLGSGNAHVDSSGNLFVNACSGCGGGGFTPGGDLGGSSSSQEVTGILNHALPALATGYLNWNGTAWVFSAGGGGGIGYPSGNGVSIVSGGAAWGTTVAAVNGSVLYGSGGAWVASSAPVLSAANMTSFPTFNQSTTGNAATATALAALPNQCTGGQFATGVAASGNANCSTPAGSGNVTGPGSSTSNDVAAFSGTGGTLLLDTAILYTNLTTQTSNGAANQVCTYTGANKICVPAALTSTFLPLTAMGTITGGTWQGTAVGAAYGGLGLASPAAHSLVVAEGSSAFNLVTSSTTNGYYGCGFNVTGAAAVDPACSLGGVPVVAETGATDTLAYSYRANFLNVSGGTTFGLTLPAVSGNLASNLPFAMYNGNSGSATLTPTTPNNINAGTSQAALVVPSKWADFVYQDASSPANWHDLGGGVPTAAAFPSSACGSTTFLQMTTLGAFTCGTPAGSGTVTASPQYDVPYYSASGTASTVVGAAIAGFQFDSTSGAPAAATGAELSALAQTLTGCNTAGYVYTPQASDCVAQSGGANTALSNLAAVAINTALLPATTNSIALGSSSDLWSNTFTTLLTTGTAPSVTTPGTGWYLLGTEGTEPASMASGTTGFVMDSTSHCPIAWMNAVNVGCADAASNTLTLTNKTISGSSNTLSAIALASLASQAANTVVGALTATTPSALAVPSCSGASSALTWTSGTGFGCNTISGGVSSVNTLTGAVVVEAATAGQVAISGGNAAALTGAADLTYATHTFSGISTTIFDLSAATGTAALKVPTNATNTATAAGAIDFDTTNKNYHGYVNGADSLFLNSASALTTNVLPKAVIATGNMLMANSSLTDTGTALTTSDTTFTVGSASCTLGTGFGFCGSTGTFGTAAASVGLFEADSTINSWRWNVNNLTQTQQLPQTAVLHSSFTNSNTTFTTITDGTRAWSWPVAASQDYVLECTLTYTGATATSNSPNFQITGPASPTAVSYTVEGAGNATTPAFVSANAASFSTSLNPFTTLASDTATYTAHIYMGLSNGSTGGTVAVQAKNTTGTDVLTIYLGSSCRMQ